MTRLTIKNKGYIVFIERIKSEHITISLYYYLYLFIYVSSYIRMRYQIINLGYNVIICEMAKIIFQPTLS